MTRHENQAIPGKMKGMQAKDSQAENNVAGSSDRNSNQKGNLPNSPSTG